MTSVEQGRAGFARQACGEALAAFTAAAGAQLEAVDQERLAVCPGQDHASDLLGPTARGGPGSAWPRADGLPYDVRIYARWRFANP
jgi:hypothetical protein